MRCEDHPYYPRKYCWGCRIRTNECALCGKSLVADADGLDVDMRAGDRPVTLTVCESCHGTLLSLAGDQRVPVYNSTCFVYRNAGDSAYELVTQEEIS
jgi:hypothetical protein